jgi:hypothetical protein
MNIFLRFINWFLPFLEFQVDCKPERTKVRVKGTLLCLASPFPCQISFYFHLFFFILFQRKMLLLLLSPSYSKHCACSFRLISANLMKINDKVYSRHIEELRLSYSHAIGDVCVFIKCIFELLAMAWPQIKMLFLIFLEHTPSIIWLLINNTKKMLNHLFPFCKPHARFLYFTKENTLAALYTLPNITDPVFHLQYLPWTKCLQFVLNNMGRLHSRCFPWRRFNVWVTANDDWYWRRQQWWLKRQQYK